MNVTEPITPAGDEPCHYDASAYFAPTTRGGIFAASAAGDDGALAPSLRLAALWRDPMRTLCLATERLYAARFGGGGVTVATNPVFSGQPLEQLPAEAAGQALADLAVTGRYSYARFAADSPTDASLLAWARAHWHRRLDGAQPAGTAPVDIWRDPAAESNLRQCIAAALDRTYVVAHAVRADPATRTALRSALGVIAVSGEDDPPDRPVNVPSSPIPQFDVTVETVVGPLRVRYGIYLPHPSPASIVRGFGVALGHASPIAAATHTVHTPLRTPPAAPTPSIPADHDVVLYVHGHSSRLEEADDLAPKLCSAGAAAGRKLAVISFDLPSSGYSEPVPQIAFASLFGGGHSIRSGATPGLDYLQQFVIDLVETLDPVLDLKRRLVAVIGGSLGGNLCLRLAERNPAVAPWIQRIVAWSPASVWDARSDGALYSDISGIAPSPATRVDLSENDTSRPEFLNLSFNEVPPGSAPQPQQWYSDHWACKAQYIEGARLERREVYNEGFRRWHWRIALEQLVFSHRAVIPGTSARVASQARGPLLLASGEDDNANYTNIYDRVRDLAALMPATTGRLLLLRNTGHSIHNERPLLLAQQIVQFLGEHY